MARYYSGNNEPLTRWGTRPVYLTTILTALFVLGLIVSAVLDIRRSGAAEWLIFSMPLAPAWSVWRAATYVLIGEMSFFTPFVILCFYWWSLGIETHLGRRALTRLLTALVLVGPAVCIAWWSVGAPASAVGNYAFTSGLLVAFATLYPNTEAWGWIPFKWLTFACIATGSLMLLGQSRWVELSMLWASCVVGFASMRSAKDAEYDDYEPPFARFRKIFRREPKLRVLPPPRVFEAEGEDVESIDPLLDKIARSGMASLSKKERARLEQAREALLKKDRR